MRKLANKLMVFFLVSSMNFVMFPQIKCAEDNSPAIIGSSVECKSGDTVNVTISLSNNPGITSVVLDIDYDKTALTLVKIKDMGLMKETSMITSPDMSDVPFRVLWNIGTSNMTSDGELLGLIFEVKTDANPGTYNVHISYLEDDIYNTTLDNIAFNITDANILVKSPHELLDDVVLGDGNEDGKVSLLDAQYVLKAALGIIEVSDIKSVDVNKDSKVTLLDAQLILKAALGIIDLK